MPSSGIELITDIGEAKLNQALGSGVAVQITEIALGDGNGANYNPGPGQKALKRERARKPIERQHMVGRKAWRVTVTFDHDTPAFHVREIGFFDAEGDLIAIWAGSDIEPRQTGAIDYALEHILNLSRVKDGLVIVNAPDDGLFGFAVSTGTAIADLQLGQLRGTDGFRAELEASSERMRGQLGRDIADLRQGQMRQAEALRTELLTHAGESRERLEAAIATVFDSIDLYVDSVSGSDDNDGSQSTPLASLGMALDRAKDGGFTRIHLKEDQSFGTSGGMTDRHVYAPGTILLRRWGGSVWSDAGRPVAHIENMVQGGKNRPAKMLMAFAPLSFAVEGVDITCDAPADPSLPGNWYQEQFIRAGGNLAGLPIGIHLFKSTVTVTGDSIPLCGCRYVENLTLGADNITLTGGASLVYRASRGSVTVAASGVTVKGTSRLLDGDTIGQNVLTNAPDVTL